MANKEVCRIDAQGAVVGRLLADGIRVWLAKDGAVAMGGIKEAKLPAWAAHDPKSGAPTDEKMRRAAVTPLSDCFFQFVNGKMAFHDETRIKAAQSVLDSMCTPVLDQDVYAYATVVCGVRAIVTIPSSLFGIKPFSKIPWIKAIAKAPLGPPGIVRPTAPPPTAAAAAAAAAPANNKRKATDSSELFPFPEFDAKIAYVSVQAAEFIEATAFDHIPATELMRDRAMSLYKAGVDAGKRLEAVYFSGKPEIVFRSVVEWLADVSSEYFRPNSLYGVTAQRVAHEALCELEKIDPAHFRFLVTLVAASRCTDASVAVLKEVKECRGVIQSAKPHDKKLFDGFVDMTIEFATAGYLAKSTAWHRERRDKLSSAAAPVVPSPDASRKKRRATLLTTGAAAPASSSSSSSSSAAAEAGAQPSGVDIGSDPNAALHVHCIASYQNVLDAHAKISDEVVQITCERDKLLVTLSVKDEVIKKLQAEVATLRTNVPGASSSSSSAAAIAASKVASLERQLKATNDLATRLIREFNTIAGLTAVNPT